MRIIYAPSPPCGYLTNLPLWLQAYKTTTTSSVVNCNSGTGGGCTSSNTATNVPIIDNSDDWEDKNVDVNPNDFAANPINILTGNKFESAVDITKTGGEYDLGLTRYYNSRSSQRGILGIGWRSDYEMQLQDQGEQIDIIQADGRQLHFSKATVATGNNLFITRYLADNPKLGYLQRTQAADPSKAAWIWTLPGGKEFQFTIHKQAISANNQGQPRFGQLSRVTERTNDGSSPYWALTYGVDGKLAQVRNHNGDTLKFSYHTTKYDLPKITITSSNDAGSSTWQYFLDKHSNLSQVVSPVGERTGYRY